MRDFKLGIIGTDQAESCDYLATSVPRGRIDLDQSTAVDFVPVRSFPCLERRADI
jgi:hypothetical protein